MLGLIIFCTHLKDFNPFRSKLKQIYSSNLDYPQLTTKARLADHFHLNSLLSYLQSQQKGPLLRFRVQPNVRFCSFNLMKPQLLLLNVI